MDVLDPRLWDQPINNRDFWRWRIFLKAELLKRRGYRSDWSGKLLTENTGAELHEGIITRSNVHHSIWWSYFIYHEFNSFLLLPAEHIPNPPSRAWCIEKAYERYGRDKVREWFYGLPWKVIPCQLP